MDLAIVVGGVALALVVLASIEIFARRPEGPPSHAEQAAEAPTTSPASLRDGLRSTRTALARGLKLAFGGTDEEMFDHLEEALVGADVGVATARELVDRVRRGVGGRDRAAVLAALRREMLAILDVGTRREAPGAGPYVILVTGVNGVGKTTTVGKLAARHRQAGRRVLLVAADTFRAAAADQLQAWAERVGADIVRHRDGGTPAAVTFDGMAAAVARSADVVLVDTAGRLHTRKALVDELRKVRRVIADAVAGAPHETLLVLDATTGQNALLQARTFSEAVDVTGVVLTKLDGTARGGIALAIAHDLGLPISDVGVGEGQADLRPFDAGEFVGGVLGTGMAGETAGPELQP